MQGISEQGARNGVDELLTVVVMSHERPVVLSRALQFHRGFPGHVLVLDTSMHSSRNVAESNAWVDYLHVPELAAFKPAELRGHALKRVRTPYVVFVADDEFLVAQTHSRCVEFLERHSDYGFCFGYSLGYLATGKNVRYCMRQRKGPEDFADEDAAQRVLRLARHFVPLQGAVVRTELARRWSTQAAMIEEAYQAVGYAAFLLQAAKGRVLSMPYSVQALHYPEEEFEAAIAKILQGGEASSVQARARYVEVMTAMPELAARADLLQDMLVLVSQCLAERASLTLEELFSVTPEWQREAEYHFQPKQYVQMPFYNEQFFALLGQIELLLLALPGAPAQLQSLEGILLKQRDLARPRKGQDETQMRERVREAFDLYPFETQLGYRLLADLRQRDDEGLLPRLEHWLARLESIDGAEIAQIFERSLSGLLYQRLHAWQPSEAQQDLLKKQAAGAGPLFGLALLDLEGNLDKLQITLDSLLEGAWTRFQVVVLTTAVPPVATRESDRLHFIRVQAVDWQRALNQVAGRAQWEWLLLAETGVSFTPYGLLKVASELAVADGCRAVYCDELQRLAAGTLTSLYRPSFNLDLLLSSPRSMSNHWFIRRRTFVELGGYSARYPQASALDLILRMIETYGMSGIGHIDELLLISEQDGCESNLDELNALRRHLVARGYDRGAVLQSRPRAYHLRYGHAERPLVSIMVPTRDQLVMVSRCIESIFERTRYTLFEVLLVDNQSETDEALHWLAGLEAMSDERLRVLRYDFPFNFSAMNNFAAREARGEYLVLLNNDTEIIDSHWLDELLNHALRPEVGIVGARLHYPGGTLQHAGVVLGLRGPAEHPWLGRDPQAPSYMGRSQLDQNFSAVTAACLMIRKAIYEEVGGLDEEAFAVSYNDVDLCLKVGRAGYLNVWAHRAVVMHEGSVSQKSVDPLSQSAKRLRFVKEQCAFYERWMPQLINDPAYNRNLSLCGNGFEVDDKPLIEPSLRSEPMLLIVPGKHERAELADGWAALAGVARVSLGQSRLQIADLLRMAPDVLVAPGALCRHDPLALALFKQYYHGVKVLNLDVLDGLDWDGIGPVPDFVLRGLAHVDRVLVRSVEVARLLREWHDDVRVVPPLLVSTNVTEQVFEAAPLVACLP